MKAILLILMLLAIPFTCASCYNMTYPDGEIKTFCYVGTVSIDAGETTVYDGEMNETEIVNETEVETEDTDLYVYRIVKETKPIKLNSGRHLGLYNTKHILYL